MLPYSAKINSRHRGHVTPLEPELIRRILVRLPNWLGDTVMALPALRAIRKSWPAGEITLAGPWAGLLSSQSVGDHFLNVRQEWRNPAGFVWSARSASFDLAVLFPNSFQSALFSWLGGIRWRVGYRSDGRGWLLTHPVPRPSGITHQVEEYLGLISAVGIPSGESIPRYSVTPRDADRAWEILRALGLGPESRFIGIQLGAAFGPSKRWLPERLVELVERLHAAVGAEPLLLGPMEEQPLAEWIAARTSVPVHSLVGKDNPDLLPAVLACCRALVSADSGPAHLAAAVGTPVVTLFGPTDPRKTRPLGPSQTALSAHVPCSPCFLPRCPIDHLCMKGITVQQVSENLGASLTSAGRAHH
jgi:heptosyltransferase-2